MLKKFGNGVREGKEIHGNICNSTDFQCQDFNTMYQATEMYLGKIAVQTLEALIKFHQGSYSLLRAT